MKIISAAILFVSWLWINSCLNILCSKLNESIFRVMMEFQCNIAIVREAGIPRWRNPAVVSPQFEELNTVVHSGSHYKGLFFGPVYYWTCHNWGSSDTIIWRCRLHLNIMCKLVYNMISGLRPLTLTASSVATWQTAWSWRYEKLI
jgi:hypothetical protein